MHVADSRAGAKECTHAELLVGAASSSGCPACGADLLNGHEVTRVFGHIIVVTCPSMTGWSLYQR